MPKVSRSREIDASPEEIWRVVTDPDHLPRWWPRTTRVEDVSRGKKAKRLRWTQVMQTATGGVVRADYKANLARQPELFGWEQEIEGTPFERFLRAQEVKIELKPSHDRTKVVLTSIQKARGVSRLGSMLMRRGAGQTLDEALDGLDLAVAGPRP